MNAIPLSFPHIYGKSMISACNCSLAPVTELIIGTGLPRRVPIFTCCTCVIINSTPFHSYNVLVGMVYGDSTFLLRLYYEVWFIWIKLKNCFFFSFCWFFLTLAFQAKSSQFHIFLPGGLLNKVISCNTCVICTWHVFLAVKSYAFYWLNKR